MNIEKERKAFEEWWSKAKNTLKCDEYDAFEIWAASSNREGYKLVPLEDTTDMWYEGNCVLDNGGSVSDIYKAMIGACDEK